MKKIYSILLGLLLSTPFYAQEVAVGSDTTHDLLRGPINAYYEYSYFQTIYQASDLNATGNITALKYKMNNEDAIDASDDNVDVWIGHTTKSKFDNQSDWVDVSTLTQVLTNGHISKEGKIVTITLDTPFAYNGTDNLVIAIDANEAGYDSTGDRFFYSSTNNVVTLGSYSDSVNTNPTNPNDGATHNMSYSYPNIVFVGLAQSCPYPTNLSVGNITSTSAELQWQEMGSATNWTIEYGEKGFTQGEGTVVNVNTNPYTLDNLNSGTEYQFYVKSNCGDGEQSSWSEVYDFETICLIINSHYTADLSVNPPLCWLEGRGRRSINEPFSEGASFWRTGAYINADGQSTASSVINIAGISRKEWMISPIIDFNTNTYELDMTVAITQYSPDEAGSEAGTMGNDDEVEVLISFDDGTVWTNITTWNKDNQPSTTGTDFTADLSDYTGAGMGKIAIYATSGYNDDGQDDDHDFHIGKFKLTATNLAVDDVKKAENFQYYPNPVNDFLYIKGQRKVSKVQIFDMSGRLVYAQDFKNDFVKIDARNLAKGNYIVNAEIDGNMKTFKVVKR